MNGTLEDTQFAPNVERFSLLVCGSVPTVVRSYKASVTWRANRLPEHLDHPVWQRNDYEHLVREDVDREIIETYIADNPQIWDQDRIHPNHTPVGARRRMERRSSS